MTQPPHDAEQGPEDVLSMGEGRGPRWGLVGLALAVLLGVLGWQLVARPEAPAAPAAASTSTTSTTGDDSGRVLVSDALPRLRREHTAPSVRLGPRAVTLSGPGVVQAERETSARAFGRLPGGWLVALTSTACEDRRNAEVSWGTARASGRFTAWDAVTTRRGTVWRSPDRSLVLAEDGLRLVVRRPATDRVVLVYRAAG